MLCSTPKAPRSSRRAAARRGTGGSDGSPLAIMYRVDGSSDLDEFTLDHFEGYKGSSPVRIGNGAAGQLQLDIYGEAMGSIYQMDHRAPVVADRGWQDITTMLGWLCEHWDQPDEGIWETRGGRRPFMYGRLQSWAAFDVAIRMATERARPADVARWVAERDRLYHTVMHKGWNPKLKAFVQYEGSDVLDASALLMPAVGMIVPTDEKWASTMSAMDKTLVSDRLVPLRPSRPGPRGFGNPGPQSGPPANWLSGRRLGVQRASRGPADRPRAADQGPPPRRNALDLGFQREAQDRPDHHDQPEHEDIVESRRDRDGAHQVGGDQDLQPEQQGPAERLAQYQVSLCRPAGPPACQRREHERPDHADHQDRGSQCLETLGNVIHQPGKRLGRRLGSNRREDHVSLPHMPSLSWPSEPSSSLSPARYPTRRLRRVSVDAGHWAWD